ncbi:MAG: tRNA (adenosine(37)-N6)-threonylcarbamoyltransferase complex ATPase subunit type 1 TsaE [Clostridia bacterium]|nr:tRNA (adenosine(37)-N6)-threonylcarbamoyltransferase complex ATPase subunit type 1 TsaE [Clostridia bacterium]
MKFISKSEAETEHFAEKLAEKYQESPTFLLFGNLGAGKTAFTRGLARGYGSSVRVSSPTFTLVHEYSGDKKVYHFDLYRIESEEELFDIGFEEYFSENTVRVIEWPDAFLDLMPEDSIEIHITYGDDDATRVIEVKEN